MRVAKNMNNSNRMERTPIQEPECQRQCSQSDSFLNEVVELFDCDLQVFDMLVFHFLCLGALRNLRDQVV